MRTETMRRMLRRAGRAIAGLEAEERASVYSHANRHTTFLDTPALEHSTSSSSFDPAELKTGKVTVYLILPPDQMRAQAPLVRLWVGSLLRAVVKSGLGEENKVYFALDEAATLAKLEVMEDAVAQYRGYGVRLIMAYQSLGQLKLCWRDGADTTVKANCSHVYFGIREYETANEVSKMLGQGTVLLDEDSTNHGSSTSSNKMDAGGSIGTSRGGGTSYKQHGKPLARPEELLTLDQRTAITFTPDVPPIVSHLVPYYEQPAAPTSWQRFKHKAEPWFVAVSMLVLSSMAGAWMWAFLAPFRSR